MSEQKKYSVYNILRNRFPESEYVLIAEVSDKSGFSRSRSLDYMLVNLWESRGLAITGIELKSNRSDWLRELKNPKKQENHFKYCDYFYVLTDNINAFPEEIPVNWGHWHITEKGVFKIVKQAPKLSSIPVDRSLLCAMLRRAQTKTGFVHIDTLEDKIAEAAERRLKEVDWQTKSKLSDYDRLLNDVTQFEQASGIKLKDYYDSYGYLQAKDIGRAVKYFLKYDFDHYVKRMQALKEQAAGVSKAITDSLSKIEKEEIIDVPRGT